MDWSRLALRRSDRPQSSEELEKEKDGRVHLFQQLDEVSRFIHSFRTKLRFGELSRAPLRLLRFQLQGKTVECDWAARLPDEWELDLPHHSRERQRL